MQTAKTLIILGGCQDDLSLCWAQSFCWFCRAAAHLVYRFFRSCSPVVKLYLWQWSSSLTFALAGTTQQSVELVFLFIWVVRCPEPGKICQQLAYHKIKKKSNTRNVTAAIFKIELWCFTIHLCIQKIGEGTANSVDPDQTNPWAVSWATSWENFLLPYANNKGADHPGHSHCLISAFIIHCLDSILLVSVSKISSL